VKASNLLGVGIDPLARAGFVRDVDGALRIGWPSKDRAVIEAIRKNVIVLITPALEVDGATVRLTCNNYRKANPGKQAPPLLYWGKYVAHDKQSRWARDGAGAVSKSDEDLLEYHPVVLPISTNRSRSFTPRRNWTLQTRGLIRWSSMSGTCSRITRSKR